MQTVNIGGKTVELSGSILAPLTYYNAFHADELFESLSRVEASAKNMLDVLHLTWVMAHDAAVASGKEAPGFEAWCKTVAGDADFSALRDAVMAESAATWFRSAIEQLEREQREQREQREREAASGGGAGERQEDGA